MTFIMHQSYGYTAAGRFSFAINRFLRLYPQYWAATLLSLLLIIALGTDASTGYHKSLYLPPAATNLLQNLLMLFTAWYPDSINPRLVPPAWSLTVEIFFYLLICMGISRTLFRVKVWLAISVLYVVFSYIAGWGWAARYYPVAAASLPFAVGAFIYFAAANGRINPLTRKWHLSATSLYILFLFNCVIWAIDSTQNSGAMGETGFYLNVVICGLLIYSLAMNGTIIAINQRVDKVIGDYSYPVYLLHWQCGLISSYILFGSAFHEYSLRGFISLMAAFVLVAIISTLIIRFIDRPIQSGRLKIKEHFLDQKH
jgi:peptidoglycan/LPS O-acetylase OafA/YrhL